MAEYPLPRDFHIEPADLAVAASGLNRPECVLALSSGRLITSHGRGGYSVIEPSRSVRHVLPRTPSRDYIANGIALGPDGVVRFADLEPSGGGVYALSDQGELSTELRSVAGEALPPTNFVTFEDDGAMWFSVMTRTQPRWEAWRTEGGSGFIGVRDSRGTRIVADGLGYANEFAFSPDGRWVYVNETYARRVSRFPRLDDNALGEKEVVAQLAGADIPDGLNFDAHGGLWITCIGSNRLLVLRPDDGEVQTVIDGADAAYSERLGHRLTAGTLGYDDMQSAGGSPLGNISSVTFGGPGLTTVYLGCLLCDSVKSFQSPVPGHPLAHWNRRLSSQA